MKPHKIEFLYLSQEDLLKSGCLDINLAMDAAERGMLGNSWVTPYVLIFLYQEMGLDSI